MATEPRTLGARLGRAARTHVRLVAAIVVGVTGAAALYSFLAPGRYEARAELLVSPVGADPLYAGLDVLRDTGDRTAAETVAELAVAPSVLDAIRVRLDVDDRDALRDAVDVDAVGDSNVVAIIGKDDEPARAAQIANAFAEETLAQQSARFQAAVGALTDRTRRTLDSIPADERDGAEARTLVRRLRQLESLRGLPDPALQRVGDAVAPRDPVWPKPELIVPVALIASVLCALAVALALDLELAPRTRARAVDTAATLDAREAAIARRERALDEREAGTRAEAEDGVRATFEPEPGATLPIEDGLWNLNELERRVRDRAGDFTPDQVAEWEAYVDALRPQAAADGSLPRSLDPLVADVFEALMRRRGDGRGEE